jgi:hypothetical protein
MPVWRSYSSSSARNVFDDGLGGFGGVVVDVLAPDRRGCTHEIQDDYTPVGVRGSH